MESLDLLSDTQQPSASALERFYSNGNPLLSNLQGVEPELEADLLQKMEKRGGDVKRTPMASLRSPLVGDLASPHSQANTDRSSLQLPSKVSSLQDTLPVISRRYYKNTAVKETICAWYNTQLF